MHVVIRVILLYLLHFFLRTIATVNPGCECVVYQSFGRSQGKFTSPNFPRFYPRNINCILYTFIGDIGEIVELTFLQFDLRMPVATGCTDYVRFFLNLDRPVVNQYTGWNYDLCGNLTSIQKRHYSSGRSIILELHSDSQPGNFTGFMGNFRFLDERQYKTDCMKEVGTKCTYLCKSLNHSKTGKFFSPGYPQPYPPRASCQYIFRGRVGERISVVFQNMQMHHEDKSCKDSPDVVTVHDGMDKSAPVIGRYCSVHNQIELISSKQFLYIDFYADDVNERQGFAATFSFCKNCFAVPSRLQTTTAKNRPSNSHGIRGITISPNIATYSPDTSYGHDSVWHLTVGKQCSGTQCL